MVFQLITFFMLVINFKAAETDTSLKLPVIGSARPVEAQGQGELLVLNLTSDRKLTARGKEEANIEAFIKKEVDYLKLVTKDFKADDLPITVVIRADRTVLVEFLMRIVKACQAVGCRKFDFMVMREAREAGAGGGQLAWGDTRKKRPQGEVELNMAAMLDMAFQLLAFFILTFRPSAVEAQVSLRMPPAKATSDGQSGTFELDKAPDEDVTNYLTVRVISREGGEIGRIEIGGEGMPGDGDPRQVMASLNARLAQKIAPFEGITLQASRDLVYERLMQVVDICTRQTLSNGQPLTQISISEIGPGQ